MKNAVMQDDLEEFSASADLSFVSHDSPSISASNMFATASKAPSYQPYAWNWLNKILDFVDGKTNGKAGQIQRILSYLFFGGLAAMVNLVVFGLALYLVHFPSSVSAQAHYVIAYIIAAECSIMANFLPNDRFTFRSLPGANAPGCSVACASTQRVSWVRC